MRRAILARAYGFGPNLVPNHEKLRVGDVVLTRRRPKNSSTSKPSAIARKQQENGFDDDQSSWTHVSLYVGDLHVLESHGFKDRYWVPDFLSGLSGFMAGVQVRPLTEYSNTCDLRFLRHVDPDYDSVRSSIARHGLLDRCVNRRKYGYMRAISGGLPSKLREKIRPRLDREVICSELVVECLAIGGTVLVEEYNQLLSGERYFYPADFAAHPSFKAVEVDFRQVVVS